MKRNLLILLVITLSGLTALTNWSEISYRAFVSESNDEVDIITGATQNVVDQVGNKLKSGINWKHELTHQIRDDLSISLENNMFYSEKSQEYRNSYSYNFGKLDCLILAGWITELNSRWCIILPFIIKEIGPVLVWTCILHSGISTMNIF